MQAVRRGTREQIRRKIILQFQQQALVGRGLAFGSGQVGGACSQNGSLLIIRATA